MPPKKQPAKQAGKGAAAGGAAKKQQKQQKRREDEVEVVSDEEVAEQFSDEEKAGKSEADGSNSDEETPEDDAGGSNKKAELRRLKKLKKKGQLTDEQLQQHEGLQVKASVRGQQKDGGAGAAGPSDLESLKAAQAASAITGMETANKAQIESSMSRDIRVDKFSLAYQSKILFRDADLRISYGHKYGVIGPNGAGKSTLLRHISGRHLPLPSHIRILHVEQEAKGEDISALHSVLNADTERLDLLKEESELKVKAQENSDAGLKASERLVEVYDRLRVINAHTAEARAAAVLLGLQFTQKMLTQPTKEFSGGWRMRVALARALFLSPDLLILDEPSNFLDLNAVIWLEVYLKRFKKTLLVVSHDRDFLNYFTTDIIYVHQQKLEYYRGDYDTFERSVLQTTKQTDKQLKKQQKELDKIQQTQTKKAKDKKAKMEQAGLVGKKDREYSVSFEFDDPGTLAPPIIHVKDASFKWPADPCELFDKLDLNIDMDSKIGIVGPNGAGKSTLMNLILGELECTAGEITRNRHLRTVKFAQHFVDQLDMSANPVAYIQKSFPDMTDLEIRKHLGRFGLKGQTQIQPISLLSGGQKSRVMLTNIALNKPHILFMDEPTNNLDIESVDALIDALKDFPGGLVVISHDQRLITTVCNELWVVANRKVELWDGDFDSYRQTIIDSMDDSLFEDDEEEEEVKQFEKPKQKPKKK